MAEKHLDSLKVSFKKVANLKPPGHDGIHRSWFKDSHLFTTDYISKYVNSCKEQAFLNGW